MLHSQEQQCEFERSNQYDISHQDLHARVLEMTVRLRSALSSRLFSHTLRALETQLQDAEIVLAVLVMKSPRVSNLQG
jgi:hypothetical protein